jgi:dihydropteroate synthase
VRRTEVSRQKPQGSEFHASISDVRVLGIVNITEDSFSDGGKFLDSAAALAHARQLAADGADILDLGAAASNPKAQPVSAEAEIARLSPVVAQLKKDKLLISVDTFSPEVQRWALEQDVDYLNDIQGFPFPEAYPVLADARAGLIVMHSIHGLGPARREAVEPAEIFDRVVSYFDERLAQLEHAGVARARLILDPGMGLFLGTRREASFIMLRSLAELKARFGLPLLVSVSRKSFLRTFIDRSAQDAGPASLAAELYAAVVQQVDFVRTHDPRALKDALRVWYAIGRPP